MSEFYISRNKLLSLYVDQLMAHKGVGSLNLDEQKQLKAKLEQKLDYSIQEAMIDALSNEKLEELDRRLDEGMTDEELELFFEYNSPEVEMKSVLADVLEKFSEDYLSSAPEVGAAPEAGPMEVASQVEQMVVPGGLLSDFEGGF